MKRLLTLMLALSALAASAQTARHELRSGNRNYDKQRFEQAETDYRRALSQDSADFHGQYNLANSLYRQERYGEAAEHYEQASVQPGISDHRRAQTLHNLGNSRLKAAQQATDQEQMQGLRQAVHSYQEALKLEPKRDDTRYNLAYARRLLQQAEQQQQQQGQNQQNQDQNGDNQQQQQQNQQDQQQQNQQDQQQNQQQQQQQQDQQNGQQQQRRQAQQDQRKQDADRMLEAVKNNERQTLQEVQKKVQKANPRSTDKDW